jgi:hypothetical protein
MVGVMMVLWLVMLMMLMMMVKIAWALVVSVHGPTFFCLNDGIHDAMDGTELTDFFFHCDIEHAFLFLDQRALLLIVDDAIVVEPITVE